MKKYFDPELMAFVLPGVHGGSRVIKYEDKSVQVGVYTEEDQALDSANIAGSAKYNKLKQAVGFDYIDIPSSWFVLDADDPRCNLPLGKVLVYTPEDEANEVSRSLVIADKEALSEDEAAALTWYKAKLKRASDVKAITVETASGNIYDADEDAQNRMARAVSFAIQDDQVIRWKLSNNEWVDVSIGELREAGTLAGTLQATIWEGAE